MTIIDTHAHLDHLENCSEALVRAVEAGVEAVVAVSEDVPSSKKNLEIKRTIESPSIYVACGMHPSEANIESLEECLQIIRDNSSELCAVGEIGLDFWYKWVRKSDEKKDEQRQVFRGHLECAKELDLPVVIHSRGAWKECFSTVVEMEIKKAEFHWYSGPVDILDDIVAAGYYVSATPSLVYSSQAREAILRAPIEQVLIETDTPVFYRNRDDSEDKGFRAEPKDVLRTLDAYCALKDIVREDVVEILNRNAKKFFGINL